MGVGSSVSTPVTRTAVSGTAPPAGIGTRSSTLKGPSAVPATALMPPFRLTAGSFSRRVVPGSRPMSPAAPSVMWPAVSRTVK